MAKDELSLEDVKRMAADIGLTRLEEGQLQELRRATLAARSRRAALPAGKLALADEPAHVFRLAADDAQ
jgi:hypothetical protein